MTRLLEQLSKRDIETRAEAVIQKVYGTEAYLGASDPESMIEHHYGLRLFFGTPEDIGQTATVLGAIFFENREVFINEALLPAQGRLRFTLAHELGHWLLHQEVVDPIDYAWPFVPGKRARGRLILCRAGDSTLIEWQANIFAAALLMPRWSFGQKVHSLAGDMNLSRISSGYLISKSDYNTLLMELSSHFEVSREAARYRLKDLSLVTIGDPNQTQLLL